MVEKKFPIGVQSFQKLREEDYLYVDKTQCVYQLAKDYNYVFLSRPRRFGKSLFSSTLKSYFEGRKDLFEGLAVEKFETEWAQHPVLYFDFSTFKYQTVEQSFDELNSILIEKERIYGRNEGANTISQRVLSLIQRAYEQTGKQVVLIIDEYDCPLLEVMHDTVKLEEIRNFFRAFYSPIKGCDSYLRFVFLTGVTKFSQLSIFSEFNNLKDISMMPEYSGICGITQNELETQLRPYVEAMAEKQGLSTDEMFGELKKNYDGYHFSEDAADVFNPFSIINALSDKRIGDYWFSTGTPAFLIKMLEKSDVNFDELQSVEMLAGNFATPTNDRADIYPLFYQSGYLTIKDYNAKDRCYTLGIPNQEVLVGLSQSLLPIYSNKMMREANSEVIALKRSFDSGDIESVLARLKSFYASIPYDLENKTEKHYQTIFFVIFSLIGSYIDVEVKTAIGRADAVVKTDTHIYVIEMKMDGSAADALKQIDEKSYMLPYAVDGRKLVKIGINFDSTVRTLGEWIIKEA